MAISTIGTDALASAAVTSAKLASGAPSRSQLPAGTVLQVVQFATTADNSTTSTSFGNTSITASITPTSATSKIMVTLTASVRKASLTDNAAFIRVLRNGSEIMQQQYVAWNGVSSSYMQEAASINYLDSPASTSAQTYLIQLRAATGGSPVQINHDTSTATFTLTEIAA